jgi:hypothetical protein
VQTESALNIDRNEGADLTNLAGFDEEQFCTGRMLIAASGPATGPEAPPESGFAPQPFFLSRPADFT